MRGQHRITGLGAKRLKMAVVAGRCCMAPVGQAGQGNTATTAPLLLGVLPPQVRDKTVKSGEGVIALNQSANRDEEHFPDPDRFDIKRSPNPEVRAPLLVRQGMRVGERGAGAAIRGSTLVHTCLARSVGGCQLHPEMHALPWLDNGS